MTELPAHYEKFKVIDLEKDKKTFWLVNLMSVVLAVGMFLIGCAIVPFHVRDWAIGEIVMAAFVCVLGCVGYIFLHEGVHGIFIYGFSKEVPTFGLRGAFAYTGSLSFFSKVQYIIIALSPVVILGMVLFITNFFCVGVWFWAVYFIQIINISGAAGDYFVSIKMLTYPKDILVRDTGTETTVYRRV